jgi:hypothetical protein
MSHLRIAELIKDILSILARAHDPGLAQHPELLRDVDLGPLQGCLEVANAGFLGTQFIQDAQSHRVGQCLEPGGQLNVSLLIHAKP